MAYKTFAAGNVLTASDLNTYLMAQSVITCTAATRPSAPSEGMTIYETDTDRVLTYSGSAWEIAVGTGAWTSFSPAFLDLGGGTNWAIGNGTITGAYARFGRFICQTFQVVMGTTTTFGTDFLAMSLPVNCAWATNDRGAGFALAKDASGGITYPCDVSVVANNFSVAAQASGGTWATWDAVDSTTPFAWDSTDRLEGIFIYEAAT